MKNNFRIILTVVLMTVFAITACEGPEGPTGPQGASGPQGEQGPEGPQGEEGTANVIYSEWIPANWNIQDEADRKAMYIEESQVTGDFLNTGTLLVYFRTNTSAVSALPYANYTISITFTIADVESNGTEYKGIFIEAEQRDGTITPPPLPGWISDIEIRYVLIPDGVPAKMPPGFFEDYQKVCEYYGIEE